MPIVFQINECLNGSTGKIARQIGDLAISEGYDSYIAYSAWEKEFPCNSKLIRIGNKYDRYFHAIETRLFDNHGLASRKATRNLIKIIKTISPDIIHIHNIHGYYLNYDILFSYLKVSNISVVWTFHDCWAFTGHCGFFFSFRDADCEKWKTGCHHCKLLNEYPKSLFADRTKINWNKKKEVFNSIPDMTIVAVSDWIKEMTKKSFLNKFKIERIHNGIDINMFKPCGLKKNVYERYCIKEGNRLIIGVANVWESRKGLPDFCYLSSNLPSNVTILLVGVKYNQMKDLPSGIIGVERTENVQQLSELYSAADLFVNPTYGDNFPTTNLEALACGTPVVTYNTGGSPESLDEKTGIVVERGDKNGLLISTLIVLNEWDLNKTSKLCRDRAISFYDQNNNFQEYMKLYNTIIKHKSNND